MSDLAAYVQLLGGPPALGALFWVALTLVAGALLGECVFRWLGQPRIIGYGLAGMAIAALGQAPAAGVFRGDLRLIIDLALALLMFELGSRVSLRWLKANPALLAASMVEAAVCFAAITALLRWQGLDTAVALTGAAILVSTSGAMVCCVSAESGAAGQVTERSFVLTALNTLYAVLALKLIIGWLHLDRQGDWVQGISQPLYTFAGSVLAAIVLHSAVRAVMRRFDLRNEHAVLLLLGLLLVAVSLARALALSTLLVPLLAGVMLRNTSDRPCLWPRYFGTAGGVLVLLMFVAMGTVWADLVPGAALLPVALLAGAVLLARIVSRAVVLASSAMLTGIDLRQSLALSLTLSPLSATSLVLLADLQAAQPEVARQLGPVVLAAVGIMVLIGPLAVLAGLRLAGEIRRDADPAPAPALARKAPS